MADLREVRSTNRTAEGERLFHCTIGKGKKNTCSSLQLSGFEYNGMDVLFFLLICRRI